RTLAKITRRLIPFMFALYVVNYLDRINVGFAALQMNRALNFTPEVFGFGAGLFFVGYFFLEIPSNLILERVGARFWIARIMISWGIVAAATAFVRGAASFYALRLILGMAEAGFFPGMILYLTGWFPPRERARAVALFMTATALAGVIGGPLSGGILTLHHLWGLAGWQWLFLIEGVPAVMLGVLVMFWMTDSPADAAWLLPEERDWLMRELGSERGLQEKHVRLTAALSDSRIWLLSLLYFAIVTAGYGISVWLPQIIKAFGGLTDFKVGLISAIPFLIAAVAMVIVGASSDASGERRWHLGASMAIGAGALAACAWTHSPAAELAALSLGAAGVWGALGPFWSIPPSFLGGTAAAGGIALINSLGNLGGFAGPYLMGVARQTTGSYNAGLLVFAVILGFALLIVIPNARLAHVA
ncbi:MAG: MFS transporter, partial [Candidatus Binataceae bacterium]